MPRWPKKVVDQPARRATTKSSKRPARRATIVAPPPPGRSERRRKSAPGTFTSEKRAEFLERYREGLTVREAAQKTGVSAVTVFNHLRKDEQFAASYHAAMETNTDVLEDTLHLMARSGNVAALFGTLKARRPERWRDRVDVSNKDGSLLKPLADAIRRAHGVGGASEP